MIFALPSPICATAWIATTAVFAEELEDVHEGPEWQAAMASKEPMEGA
jgi:hypothetical protein